MRPLFVVLAVQLLVAVIFVVLVATGSLQFTGGHGGKATARVDRFDGRAAFALVKLQLSYGPRPAGSPASPRPGERLRTLLPTTPLPPPGRAPPHPPPERPLPARTRRPPQRRRHRARPRPEAHRGRRRPLRHEG